MLGVVQLWSHLAPDRFAMREALLKLTTDLIFMFLAGQLLAPVSTETWERIALVIVIFGFSLSVFAILQLYSSPRMIYWTVRPRWGGAILGPYVNHNHYAGLMEMLIPMAGCYVLSHPTRKELRLLFGFAVAVQIASMLLSGSRGGVISLTAEALVLVVLLGRTSGARDRGKLLVPTATAMVMAGLLFIWMDPGNAGKRLGTVVSFGNSSEVAWGDRKAIVLDCFRILRSHPWVGIGLGNFQTVYPQYQSFPSDLVWEHAHNDFIEALVETGLVGGVLICWALVVFFRLALKRLPRHMNDRRGWVQAGAALGCCGLIVHSLFDFNLHIPANAAWFAACVAWATVERPQRPSLEGNQEGSCSARSRRR